MTYEEKLDLVINEIVEARKRSRAGQNAKIFVTKQSELIKKIIPQEVHELLLQLQDDEKILQVIDYPSDLKDAWTIDINKIDYFVIGFFNTFEEWHEKFLLKKKSRPHNLDWLNILKIVDVCIDIDSKLQITKETRVVIPSFPYPCIGRFRELFPIDNIGTRQNYQQYRWEGVKYLEKEGVVSQARHDDGDMLGYANIIMKVDIQYFEDFYAKIRQEYETRANKNTKTDGKDKDEVTKNVPTKKSEEKDDIVYKITYTKLREVLMNNVQISKPDFNSENDLVFLHLYGNPNKRITKEEIEKAINGKLTKTLHKIVENLGFEGDTKDLFFSVSKKAIEFRNPITQTDLEELKKPLIKLVKGGGKLVIPQ